MRPYTLILLCLAVFPRSLPAQDVGTQYLKLQQSYTQRLLDIQTRHHTSQRELLNKFILALVRVEQRYREDANLEGVLYCRALQEQLLTQPGLPDRADDETPETISVMLDTLYSKSKELFDSHQKELHLLNTKLYTTLELYQREFSRQRMTKNVEETLALREVLSHSLEQAKKIDQAGAPLSTTLSTNPDVYPFAIEGGGYDAVPGVIPRRCMIDLQIIPEGIVKEEALGYRFINGRLRIPANQTGPLMEDLFRNRMLTVEYAFQPTFYPQGNPYNRVVLFQIGEDTDRALFSLTIENQTLCLYFMTDVPPPDRENYRFTIGEFNSLEPVLLTVTYRQGELIAYMNGDKTLTIRNEITGTLDNWKPTPVILGKAISRRGFIYPFRGVFHHVYIKAGDTTSRQILTNYNRFLSLFK